jgi:hypothetical protein
MTVVDTGELTSQRLTRLPSSAEQKQPIISLMRQPLCSANDGNLRNLRRFEEIGDWSLDIGSVIEEPITNIQYPITNDQSHRLRPAAALRHSATRNSRIIAAHDLLSGSPDDIFNAEQPGMAR